MRAPSYIYVRRHASYSVGASARNVMLADVTDDTDRVSAWRALLTAHAGALRAIEEELARAGTIPLPWYDVLLELNAAPGRRLRMSELADRVVLSRTRVSRVVDELVERRPRSPRDRSRRPAQPLRRAHRRGTRATTPDRAPLSRRNRKTLHPPPHRPRTQRDRDRTRPRRRPPPRTTGRMTSEPRSVDGGTRTAASRAWTGCRGHGISSSVRCSGNGLRQSRRSETTALGIRPERTRRPPAQAAGFRRSAGPRGAYRGGRARRPPAHLRTTPPR